MKRSVRIAVILVLLGLVGAGGWYWHQRQEAALADRALSDIPTEEYEAWMQELGYVD